MGYMKLNFSEYCVSITHSWLSKRGIVRSRPIITLVVVLVVLLVSDFGDFLGDDHGIGSRDLRLAKSTVVERAVVLVAVAVDPAEHTATPGDKLLVKIIMVSVMMVKIMMMDAEGCVYLFHSTSLYTGSQVDDHDVFVVVVVVYVIVVDYHYVDVVVDDYVMGCGGMYLCHSTPRRTWKPKRHIL